MVTVTQGEARGAHLAKMLLLGAAILFGLSLICVKPTLGILFLLVVGIGLGLRNIVGRRAAAPVNVTVQPIATVPLPPQRFAVDALLLNEQGSVEIVGESHYQPAIRAAVDAYRGPGDQQPRHLAVLIPEPDNAYDPHAIAVYLERQAKVGHLSREDALAYGPLVRQLARQGKVAACHARIYGGRPGKPSFGIWLDLAPPELALED